MRIDEDELKAQENSEVMGLVWGSSAPQSFQERWDAVRRNLYGNMYNDCWLPCEERGGSFVYPLPSETAQRLREGSKFISVELFVNNLRDELNTRLRQEAERARRKRLQEIRAKMTPHLSVDEALDMQSELRDGFAGPWFQGELATIQRQHGAQPLKVTLLRAELIFEIQRDILIKYGFEGTRQSIAVMLQSFEPLTNIRSFREVSDQCNYLLGLDHRFLTSLEDMAETQQKSEEWKQFFRDGGWEKWKGDW